MDRNTRQDVRNSGQQDQQPDDRVDLGQEREHGGIPTGTPRQPAPDESQFLPDTGDANSPTTDRPREDIMDEARDGFMDRYPPRGQ